MKSLTMKTFISVLTLNVLLLNGCSSVVGMTTIGTDMSLPQVKGVKHLVDKGSVGFEWPAINSQNIEGIKVYRTITNGQTIQKYKNIATIPNRYATHYVDRTIKPNQNYRYSFTTYRLLKESLPGDVVDVSTKTAIEPVGFLNLYQIHKGVIKVLWSPHTNKDVSGYIVQRKLNGSRWRFLARVRGRLMPEYIDSSVGVGYGYGYRVIAVTSYGTSSEPSEPSYIEVK